jgi:hypothetical protein
MSDLAVHDGAIWLFTMGEIRMLIGFSLENMFLLYGWESTLAFAGNADGRAWLMRLLAALSPIIFP